MNYDKRCNPQSSSRLHGRLALWAGCATGRPTAGARCSARTASKAYIPDKTQTQTLLERYRRRRGPWRWRCTDSRTRPGSSSHPRGADAVARSLAGRRLDAGQGAAGCRQSPVVHHRRARNRSRTCSTSGRSSARCASATSASGVNPQALPALLFAGVLLEGGDRRLRHQHRHRRRGRGVPRHRRPHRISPGHGHGLPARGLGAHRRGADHGDRIEDDRRRRRSAPTHSSSSRSRSCSRPKPASRPTSRTSSRCSRRSRKRSTGWCSTGSSSSCGISPIRTPASRCWRAISRSATGSTRRRRWCARCSTMAN